MRSSACTTLVLAPPPPPRLHSTIQPFDGLCVWAVFSRAVQYQHGGLLLLPLAVSSPPPKRRRTRAAGALRAIAVPVKKRAAQSRVHSPKLSALHGSSTTLS